MERLEEGLWSDLSHFYYLGIGNSWRAAQYLEQTIPSDCINCSEIRLNESTQRWRHYVFGLLCNVDLVRKRDVDDVAHHFTAPSSRLSNERQHLVFKKQNKTDNVRKRIFKLTMVLRWEVKGHGYSLAADWPPQRHNRCALWCKHWLLTMFSHFRMIKSTNHKSSSVKTMDAVQVVSYLNPSYTHYDKI